MPLLTIGIALLTTFRPDLATVQHGVAAWERARNNALVHIDWRFTTGDARIKLKRLYPVLNVQLST